MKLGCVSWHHGWTLHAAGPQPAHSPPRLALSVTWFADGARLLPCQVLQQRVHDEDQESYAAWLPDLKDQAVARHRLLPLVFDAKAVGRGIDRDLRRRATAV